jgi:hypothetical protein
LWSWAAGLAWKVGGRIADFTTSGGCGLLRQDMFRRLALPAALAMAALHASAAPLRLSNVVLSETFEPNWTGG